MEDVAKKKINGVIQGQPPVPNTIIPIRYPLIAPLDETDFRFQDKPKTAKEMTIHTINSGRFPWV